MPPAPPPKRKRGAGISIFQSDAPTKTARKKAAEHSVFDHGINRADALGLGGTSQQPTLHAPVWASALGLSVPIASPIPGLHGGAGAVAFPGLALRRTRSRGCELSGAAPGTSFSAMPPPLPPGPIPGLSMRRTRSGRILLDASNSMPLWPTVATAVDQSHASRAAAAMMLPPPPPLQPTLSEWGNLGLDMGLLAGGERLPGLSMRRTRSRGPLYSGPESSAAWDSSASHNAAPPQSAHASHHASHHASYHLPPASGLSVPSSSLVPEIPLELGVPLRRTRSRGHAPLAPPALPMTHTISELVSSFIDSTPAGPGDDSSDTLRLCEQLH